MKASPINPGALRAWLNELPRRLSALLHSKRFWKDLVIMTVGMFIASLGVYFFLIPSHLIVGSITGLSLVLAKLIPGISVGTMIFIINALLLVLAFFLIGNEFGAKTVYTALILGPMINILGWIIPIQNSIFSIPIQGTSQYITYPWFDLLCFVIILSLSQSVLFSINASTGGLDILAKIINKYLHVSLGTSVTIGGGLICCTAFLINDINLVVMGLIATWLNGIILNYFMSNINSRTRVYIITDDYEKLQHFILDKLGRGVTLHDVIGGYTGKKRVQLEVVLSKDDFSDLIDFMSKEKIQSFMTSDVVSQVYGLWNKKSLLDLSEQ